MKKKKLFHITALLLVVLCVYASAAGGGPEDSLVSLAYLNGIFTDRVNAAVEDKLNSADTSSATVAVSGNWLQTRLKSGDILYGSTGTSILVLAGSVQVSISSGAVVDATAGSELSSGSVLTAGHRYLVAEDASVTFSVVSKTAVVQYQGPYRFAYSASVDYNAMAQALKAMHLFRGSLTGYGEGFDLEASPTRLQALIMFIRLLGEEDAALSWIGTIPFTDITPGTDAARYVGYAYSRGYTNGYTATTFRPAQKVNAYQYVEFVLRALGYSSTATTDLSDTLSRAVSAGVLTEAESAMLAADPFLRAELVYVSYYTLDVPLSGSGQSLRQSLISKGVFTQAKSDGAAALVSGKRI